MRKRKTEKEVPVRNNPGICKRFEYDESKKTWKDTGKFRAMRRVVKDGISRKEQAIFSNIEDARNFRGGSTDKPVSSGRDIHLNRPENSNVGMTFGGLVAKWKPFHFLKLEHSTKQTYEKRLPNLHFLMNVPVERIKTSVIDDLVSHWVETYPKGGQRCTFEKELNLVKVILNFYRKRINPSYLVPVLLEHYEAADVAKKATPEVASLTQEELSKFLDELKSSKSPIFHTMALTQFCLGLRVGELCGMRWEDVNLDTGVARIEQTVSWDLMTWEPRIKLRPKNGKVRILVMPEILVQELRRLKPQRDRDVQLIFHKKGGPMNRQTIGKAYNRALERLGYTHVRGTHMLRKTAATVANEITGDFYAVSRLMDHSSPNVTLRYVSQTSAGKRKVADALNSALMNQEKKKESSKAIESSNDDLSAPVPARPRHENPVLLRLVKSNG